MRSKSEHTKAQEYKDLMNEDFSLIKRKNIFKDNFVFLFPYFSKQTRGQSTTTWILKGEFEPFLKYLMNRQREERALHGVGKYTLLF